MANEPAASEPAPTDAPKWIYEEVIPALGSRVRSLHLLKQKGGRRSVLLFSEEAALVAEKGRVQASRGKVVRGIVLKTEQLPLDAWIDELSRELTQEAEQSEQGRIALERLLGA